MLLEGPSLHFRIFNIILIGNDYLYHYGFNNSFAYFSFLTNSLYLQVTSVN